MSLTPCTPPFWLFLGFLNSLEFLSPLRLETLKTLIIECLEELSPNAVLEVYLVRVAHAIIRGTGSSAPCTPTLGAGWALGPARNTLRVLCPSTQVVCVGATGVLLGVVSSPAPGPVPAAAPQLLIILKTTVCGLSEPSAAGYGNLKDGVLSVSSLMALTVF